MYEANLNFAFYEVAVAFKLEADIHGEIQPIAEQTNLPV